MENNNEYQESPTNQDLGLSSEQILEHQSAIIAAKQDAERDQRAKEAEEARLRKAGKATPEQIAAWKQEHGEVHEVEVEDHFCYLKNPSRKVLGYASTAGKQNPIKFNEIMLAGCWVGGDEKMKTDDSLFLAVGSVLQELVQVKEATIKKL